MIKLPDITLMAVSSIKIPETLIMLEYSMRNIKFADVKIITHEKLDWLNKLIKHEHCDIIDDIMKYNELVFYDLGNYFETTHVLLIQPDSAVINADLWNDEWTEFDYLGAPWPIIWNSYMANNGTQSRVGNGGFSLRSKFLCDTPKKIGLKLKQEQDQWNEDGNICCYYKKEMLEQGIKYAPVEVAAHFSYENETEENKNISKFFGFHKNYPRR